MDIPYTVEVRRDTGLTNGRIGIWLFLASEVMLFGALFASYILIRAGAESWPRGDTILNVPLATFNTLVLISSSVTMVMAWASLMRGRFPTYRKYMGATILLGFVFLVVKYFEYSAKFEHHLYPSTNNFLAIYFTLTGLHMLHVIGGMAIHHQLRRAVSEGVAVARAQERVGAIISDTGDDVPGHRPALELLQMTADVDDRADEVALDELERSDKSTALITLCIGGGMGTATVIERV